MAGSPLTRCSRVVQLILLLLPVFASGADLAAGPSGAQPQQRMFERTFESKKIYANPFSDVDVDVIFSKEGRTWRVPTFWRGGQRWTVRFTPPAPGVYSYRLESTDPSSPDLNGRVGTLATAEYRGSSVLLRRGALRLSGNGRYFEHADGTPFFWLGDTWWTGLSDRISWSGFQKLTHDRRAKGFTIVQIVAGLVPVDQPKPMESGFCNEGGCVWDPGFTTINPSYFDYADRRIQWLVSNDLVPAIVGSWSAVLEQTGVEAMKKHWRYVIARYGAYPVVWIVGGEVFDPPLEQPPRIQLSSKVQRAWTEITRYARSVDPYRHPLTVHEIPPPLDSPVQDESLVDFDLFQGGQLGWPSIGFSVAQLSSHYARRSVTRPIVQGEIGYENHFNRHFEDYQRTAFWLSMLNGAAGHTYGADATWGAYSADKPLPKRLLSFRNWEEGMNLQGSYQVGLGAKLLRQYEWWRFQPHPEWVFPRGTTYYDAKDLVELNGWAGWWLDDRGARELGYSATMYPSEEEMRRFGSFDRPYAAGIPGQLRMVYIPVLRDTAWDEAPPPTILGLEPGTCYATYFWEPQYGIRIDLGKVQRSTVTLPVFHDAFESADRSAGAWIHARGEPVFNNGKLKASHELLSTLENVREADVIVEIAVQSNADAAVIARYQDDENYVAAVYSAGERTIHLVERRPGSDERALGKTPVRLVGGEVRLRMETRRGVGAATITDGRNVYTTPVATLNGTNAGSVGLSYRAQSDGAAQVFDEFSWWKSPALASDESSSTKLYDAAGRYRGDLGESLLALRRNKHVLLDAYRPDKLPASGDWVLVLDATNHACDARDDELMSSRK